MGVTMAVDAFRLGGGDDKPQPPVPWSAQLAGLAFCAALWLVSAAAAGAWVGIAYKVFRLTAGV